jgi:hypothetical protein
MKNQSIKGDENQNLSTQPVESPLNALSGRELDAAIAERVMGFEEVESYGQVVRYHNKERDLEYGGRWSSVVPNYSTEMDAAMQVVEKMREKGFRWEASSPRGTGWQICCFPADDAPDGYRKFKAMFPEGVCRAALAAVAHDKSEREAEITTDS